MQRAAEHLIAHHIRELDARVGSPTLGGIGILAVTVGIGTVGFARTGRVPKASAMGATRIVMARHEWVIFMSGVSGGGTARPASGVCRRRT